MKKLMAILISVCMLLSCFSAVGFASGEATEIATLEALKAISMDGDYILTADITLGADWVPLGTTDAPFTGTFNGNGKSVIFSEGAASGLFGVLGGSFEISDLSLKGAKISLTAAGGALAASVASGASGKLTSVNNFADVYSTASVGGFIGTVSGAVDVTDCFNHGEVSAAATSGIKIGGFFAETKAVVKFSLCGNMGNVTRGANNNNVGGFIGVNSKSGLSFTKCYNAGTIKAGSYGSAFVAHSSQAFSATDCYNAGSLSGTSSTSGAFIGYPQYGTITLTNCYTVTGAVAGSGSSYAAKYAFTNCYIVADSAPTAYTGVTATTREGLAEAELGSSFNVLSNWDLPQLVDNPHYFTPGTSANPYKIGSAEEFAKLEDAVAGEYYELTSDITLGERTPFDFKGILLGNGKTVNLGESAVNGVFASLSETFEIYDLNIEGKITSSAADGALAASIASGASGKLEGINNYADVHGNGSAGGFAASVAGTVNLSDCINHGNITAEAVTGISVGGFFGNTTGVATFEKCANLGNVTRGANNNFTAGFVGKNTKSGLSFNKCYNAGTIKAGSYGSAFVAHSTQAFSATDCYNAESLSGTASTSGAFIGFPQYGTITLTNCYTVTGAVAGSGSTYASKYAFTSCYIVADSAPTAYTGVTAVTTREGLAEAELGSSFKVLNNWDLPQLIDYPHFFEKGTVGNPVEISSADEFAKISDANTLYYILTEDITLSNHTPFEFKGGFDGNGHVITLDNSTSGIFSILSGSFDIKDIIIEGSVNSTDTDVGALAGKVSSASSAYVTNVTNYADVTGADRAAGIVAYDVSGGVTYSGLVNEGDINAKNAGGILAKADGVTVTLSSNKGYIKGTDYAGGIVGAVGGKSGVEMTIEKSYNTGEVSSKHGGGIAGWLASKTLITDCYNLGKIAAGYGVNGGIVSFPQTEKGTVLTNCYNAGEVVSGGYIAPYKYGNTDYTAYITTVNCYYLAETETPEQLYADSTAKTRKEFETLALDLGLAYVDGESDSLFPQLEANYREGAHKLVRVYATCGENGAISPKGETWVKAGGEITISTSGDEGYQVASLLKDGEVELKDQLKEGKIILVADDDMTVTATFEEIPVTAPSVATFNDVWYEEDGSITFGIITAGYKTTVKDFGIAYATDKEALTAWDGAENENITLYKSILAKQDAPYYGIFLRGDILKGKTYYTKTYLVYENENGEKATVLGDVIESIIK